MHHGVSHGPGPVHNEGGAGRQAAVPREEAGGGRGAPGHPEAHREGEVLVTEHREAEGAAEASILGALGDPPGDGQGAVSGHPKHLAKHCRGLKEYQKYLAVLGIKVGEKLAEAGDLLRVNGEVHGEEEDDKVLVIQLRLEVEHLDCLAVSVHPNHLAEGEQVLWLGEAVGDGDQGQAGEVGSVLEVERHLEMAWELCCVRLSWLAAARGVASSLHSRISVTHTGFVAQMYFLSFAARYFPTFVKCFPLLDTTYISFFSFLNLCQGLKFDCPFRMHGVYNV